MLTVEAPGLTFDIPSEWNEVTLKQYIQLFDRQFVNENGETVFRIRDAFECFASNVEALHQLEAHSETVLRQKLPYLKKVPDFAALELPKTIAGHVPPDELGACSLIQKWTMEHIIDDREDEGKDTTYVSLAPELLATYLYPLFNEGRPLKDRSDIYALIPTIEALPVTDALPLSAFFLSSWGNYPSSGKISYYLHYPQTPLNLWQRLRFRSWRVIKRLLFWQRLPKKNVSPTSKLNNSPMMNS